MHTIKLACLATIAATSSAILFSAPAIPPQKVNGFVSLLVAPGQGGGPQVSTHQIRNLGNFSGQLTSATGGTVYAYEEGSFFAAPEMRAEISYNPGTTAESLTADIHNQITGSFLITGPTERVDFHLVLHGLTENHGRPLGGYTDHNEAYFSLDQILTNGTEVILRDDIRVSQNAPEFNTGNLAGTIGGGFRSRFDEDVHLSLFTNTLYQITTFTETFATEAGNSAGDVFRQTTSIQSSITIASNAPQPFAYQIFFSDPFSPVPEPSTYGLFGMVALLGVVAFRRRR